MKLSIIIPIYNEEKLLPEVLKRVRALELDKELILVDDCSHDGTRDILAEEEKHPDTKVLYHERNIGKGGAIRTGLEHFTGDIVIIQDADLEYRPEEIPGIIKYIENGEEEIVYGSRFMGSVKGMRLPNRVANWLLPQIVKILYGQKLTDEATAYKAFRAHIIREVDLECTGFEFCPEITAKVIRKGYKIKEVPITFVARTFCEGKKIGWRDFIIAVKTLWKYRKYK